MVEWLKGVMDNARLYNSSIYMGNFLDGMRESKRLVNMWLGLLALSYKRTSGLMSVPMK